MGALRPLRRLLALLAGLAVIGAQASGPEPRILVFSGCGGAVHASISYVNEMWARIAKETGFAIDTSGNPAVFTRENLSRYRAVIWNNATYPGKLLDSTRRAAWFAFADTGGYVGMHASGDVGDSWPAYVTYMGGTNSTHSNTTPATLIREPGEVHPLIRHAGWPENLQLTDEWYSWRVHPRTNPGLRILYSLDEKTFVPGKAMGDDHPIMWLREMPKGGRMFYTGIGHNIDLFKPQPDKGYAMVEKLLRSALLWATHRLPAGTAVISPMASSPTMKARPLGVFEFQSPQGWLRLDASGRLLEAPQLP